MKMNKEELKRQIKLNSHSEYDKVEWGPASVYVPVAIDLIDQLDEPDEFDRVLLKHIKAIYDQYGYDYLPGFINDVKDGLAKMDEPEKVVVPAYVAEYFEKFKHDLEIAIYSLNRELVLGEFEDDSEIHEWANHKENKPIETLIRMKNGYTVKEKKYEVKDKHGCFLLTKNSEGEVINAYSKVVYKNKGQLTEQEIKDYDERYWAFAVPVEEGEDE